MTDLFSQARTYIAAQAGCVSDPRGSNNNFSLPQDMPYALREVLAAIARAVDPKIDVLKSAMDGRLCLSKPFKTFPSQQMLKALGEIKSTTASHMHTEEDGSLTLTQSPNTLPLVELEFIVRAALPYPTPIAMKYTLPEGKTYMGYDGEHHGEVTLEELLELKEFAETSNNYEAAGELAELRADHIVVSAADAPRLRAQLGIPAGRGTGAA